jgi:hypothetical protein
MTLAWFLIFLFGGAAMFTLYQLGIGLSRGRFAVRGPLIERDKNPTLYWISIGLGVCSFGLFAGGCLVFLSLLN